jgi:2-dehydropantoate 2-reductase
VHILVVGAGSTGGYFGGRLAQAGRDVTFLVRTQRAQQLQAHGLQIVSPHGDVTLHPKLVTTDTLGGHYDVVFLTIKAFSLMPAMEDFAPAVGPDTMILPVLNGMKHVDLLRDRFGEAAVIGCACKVATIVDEEGRIVQLSPLQDLAYGEMDGAISPRIGRLDAEIKDAGFDARLSKTIEREMWEKWILLVTLGASTCLFRGNIGQIEAVKGGSQLVLDLLDEVVRVAKAVGSTPDDAFVKNAQDALTMKGSPQTSSMYRDLQNGAFVEVDQIIGDLLERGRAAGVAMPLLRAAYVHLTVYQNRRAPV